MVWSGAAAATAGSISATVATAEVWSGMAEKKGGGSGAWRRGWHSVGGVDATAKTTPRVYPGRTNSCRILDTAEMQLGIVSHGDCLGRGGGGEEEKGKRRN